MKKGERYVLPAASWIPAGVDGGVPPVPRVVMRVLREVWRAYVLEARGVELSEFLSPRDRALALILSDVASDTVARERKREKRGKTDA